MKIELSHDILAQKVYERVSLEDKRLREVERLVRERYAFYQGEPKLGQEEVDFVKPYLKKVDLTANERSFVEQSRKRIVARRRRRLLTIAAVVLAIIGGLSFYAISITQLNDKIKAENAKALEARKQAEQERAKADSARKLAVAARDTAEKAQQEAMIQRDRAEKNADIAEQRAQRIRKDAKVLQVQANTLEQQADSLSRLTINLQAANQEAEAKRKEALRLRDIAQQKARAANLLTAQSLANQSLKIKDTDSESLRIKALLAREAYRIHDRFRQDSTREWASRYDPQIYNALYDALALARSDLNRVNMALGRKQRFQVRDLDRGSNHLYALTSNGYLLRWNWDRKQQSLVNEQPLIDQTSNDIYYAQAVSEAEGLLSTLGGMRGVRSFDLLADEIRTPSERDRTPDLIALAKETGQMLMGERLPNGKTRLFLRGRPHQAAFVEQGLIDVVLSHRGQWLAARNQLGHLLVYRVDLRDSLALRQGYTVSEERFSRLHFRPGTSELVAGREDGKVQRYFLLDSASEAVNNIGVLRGHSARVSDLAFDQSGRFLASTSFDGTVQVWDLASEAHQRFGPLVIHVPGGLLQALSFVPGDTVLVTGDNEGNLRTWPVDPRRWYEELLGGVPIQRERLSQQEAQRYLGDRREMESSGLFDALPEYLDQPPESGGLER